jgi:hypothetical protein
MMDKGAETGGISKEREKEEEGRGFTVYCMFPTCPWWNTLHVFKWGKVGRSERLALFLFYRVNVTSAELQAQNSVKSCQ